MSRKPEMRSYLAATPRFASGADSPRDFLERCIAAIEQLDPDIGAFTHLNLGRARTEADAATQRWRAGRQLSAIDGMPVGIKDIIETADLPTEQGSPLFAGYKGGRDAASVVALREAGALAIGKTVTTEFASTEPRGTRNPWDTQRTPGGSSSGSAAAVAAGMVPAALGTQVLGSILRPSSFCGCYGFKPSVGGINRGGSYDYLSQSCDGPLAATLEECWVIAREISARAGGDPGYPGVSGPRTPPAARMPRRIAVIETAGWARAEPPAKEAFERAVARINAAGVALVRRSESAVAAVEAAIADALPLSRSVNNWEGRWPLNAYARDMDRNGLSRAAQGRLADAEAMTLEQYQEQIAERARVREVYARLASAADCVVTLSALGAAPVGLASTGEAVFNAPGSLLGVPAVSLPVLQVDGLPLGLQVMGFVNADAMLIAHAAAIRDCVTA